MPAYGESTMTAGGLEVWRLDLGLSQREAADVLGMKLKSYQELERGRRFDNSKPTTIDRRTELACRAIKAGLHLEA